MKISFLLISDRDESNWSEVLRETLVHLGSVQVVSEEETNFRVLDAHFDLIIMDASAVKRAAQLVSHLRSQRPDVRIMVTTAAPTWREARDVLRAGAVDYYRWSLNKEELSSVIQEALDLPEFVGAD